jgi:hypothetical protein
MSLNAFFELVGIMRRRGLPTDGASLVQLTVDGAKEHGIFLGLLLSVYNSFNYATRNAPMPYARYRGAAAGALAGLSSLWALPASMRRSALLFLSVRAFELACRVAARRGVRLRPGGGGGKTYLLGRGAGAADVSYAEERRHVPDVGRLSADDLPVDVLPRGVGRCLRVRGCPRAGDRTDVHSARAAATFCSARCSSTRRWCAAWPRCSSASRSTWTR